jgi:2-oxoglutarate ferredoxin oxidoreductase subunit beta
VTAAIQHAFFELSIEPHKAAKMSGIGCSSKTPAYFLSQSHGFNSVHGRMPSVTTGANAANKHLKYIGVSGDGDSLSIGIGQLVHAMRRNINMLYVIENNGVYGLTKGQFSAAADLGTLSKYGAENTQSPIDPVSLAIGLGATFVGRSFSGDKKQLIPLIKAGLNHSGFALIDVISPCVTFNNHAGSTKSYENTRKRNHKLSQADFVPAADEISVEYKDGDTTSIEMHDGSHLFLKKVEKDYDPLNKVAAVEYMQSCIEQKQVPTGLLYYHKSALDMHAQNNSSSTAMNQIPFSKLCPGSKKLEELLKDFR